MNILALDIGNTNIGLGLFLDGEEVAIETIDGNDQILLKSTLETLWEKVPIISMSAEGRRDAVIVASSVKPVWTEMIKELIKVTFDEKVLMIGQEVPLPIPVWTDQPEQVGTDRVVAAAAAYDVVESAVAIADFGTAITVDLVDANGVFQGGVILPGLELSAGSLQEHTALLPRVQITRPETPFGKNTHDAINCGVYYAAVGGLQEIQRRFAEDLGTWPQTVMTGSSAALLREDCDFVDNYVPHLVLKGIVHAYQKYWTEKNDLE